MIYSIWCSGGDVGREEFIEAAGRIIIDISDPLVIEDQTV